MGKSKLSEYDLEVNIKEKDKLYTYDRYNSLS